MQFIIFSWLIRVNLGFERFGDFWYFSLIGVVNRVGIVVEACLWVVDEGKNVAEFFP